MFISSGYFLCSRAVLKTIIESLNHWQIFNILCIIYMLHTQCSVSIQNSFKLFSCFTSTLSPWFHIHKCAFEPPRKDLIIWHWKTCIFIHTSMCSSMLGFFFKIIMSQSGIVWYLLEQIESTRWSAFKCHKKLMCHRFIKSVFIIGKCQAFKEFKENW